MMSLRVDMTASFTGLSQVDFNTWWQLSENLNDSSDSYIKLPYAPFTQHTKRASDDNTTKLVKGEIILKSEIRSYKP